jgi:hypothetical protein
VKKATKKPAARATSVRKKPIKPNEKASFLSFNKDKGSHKLVPEAVDIIIQFTATGASTAEIITYLKTTYNVQVSSDLITYYRRKERAKLQSLALENLDVARSSG